MSPHPQRPSQPMTDWNHRFLDLASFIAGWSKDPSTQVGAIIADKSHRILSLGYNGFPSGCWDTKQERYERPLKYKWTEHAERNAIYSAGRLGVSLVGSTIYCTFFPCTDCARAIIQSGISQVITFKPDFDHERWGEDFKIAYDMLGEGGVKITYGDDL